MTETSGIYYPVEPTRTCLKCKNELPIGQFTSAGVQRARVCDSCLHEWQEAQRLKGNTGKST